MARKKIKKTYEKLQLKLQTIQKKLAQTKLKLEKINETLQQKRTKLKNDATLISFAEKPTRREKNISPFTNIQSNKKKIAFNGKIKNIDSSKKLFEKNSDDYKSGAYTVKKNLIQTNRFIQSTKKKQRTFCFKGKTRFSMRYTHGLKIKKICLGNYFSKK